MSQPWLKLTQLNQASDFPILQPKSHGCRSGLTILRNNRKQTQLRYLLPPFDSISFYDHILTYFNRICSRGNSLNHYLGEDNNAFLDFKVYENCKVWIQIQISNTNTSYEPETIALRSHFSVVLLLVDRSVKHNMSLFESPTNSNGAYVYEGTLLILVDKVGR